MAVTKAQRVMETLQKYNVTEKQAQEKLKKVLDNKNHKLHDEVVNSIVFDLKRISILNLEDILKG